jgi:hypothetical protein
MCLILSLLGWGLVNVTVYFYYAHLGEVIRSYGDNAPEELIDTWAADGAKRVFALFLGWMYEIVYSIPFFLLYGVVSWVRNLLNTHKITN